MQFKTVTIVGANGTMGFNASAIFASFGECKVYMVSRDIQKSRNAIDKAIKAVRADTIRKNLIPCDYSQIEECIKDSDIVFESVAENISIKKEITRLIGLYASEETIIATGTSGLSINDISKALPDSLRKNYCGMHFFNPPYSMPLLELIPSSSMNSNLINELKYYLKNKLLRTVVVCKDSPGFIANRIGFHFLNKSLQYSYLYRDKGGIDYIDAIMGLFTGRSMTPCMTVDFVGLDVHKAIVDNIMLNCDDDYKNDFAVPLFVQSLIARGKLGNKTASGLFKNILDESNKKTTLVYDIPSDTYVLRKRFDDILFAKSMNESLRNGDYEIAFKVLRDDDSLEANICRELLSEYVSYSIYVSKKVCDSIEYVDDAMATGFNWCPPLAMSNILFGTTYKTKYDFRSFFKAVKK